MCAFCLYIEDRSTNDDDFNVLQYLKHSYQRIRLTYYQASLTNAEKFPGTTGKLVIIDIDYNFNITLRYHVF